MPFLGTPNVQYFDNNGGFLSSGKVYFYFPGTENPVPVYPTFQDSLDKTNALSQPVVLDQYGRAAIVVVGLYKMKLTDASDNEIWTVDNLGSVQGDVYDEYENLIVHYITNDPGGNYIEFSNNIKNQPPSISSKGVDDDVDIKLSAKGTGAIYFEVGLDSSFKMPTTDGSADYLLITNGSGQLSFRAAGSYSGSYTHPAGIVECYFSATPPAGYLLCDGSAVSRTTYATLFTAISTTYGSGDGSTSFNLPNCTRRVIVCKGGTGTATLGNALGNTGGVETHTLTESELPSHSHSYPDYPAIGYLYNGLYPAFTSTLLSTDTSFATGDGGSHNNVQSSIVMYYIIKT